MKPHIDEDQDLRAAYRSWAHRVLQDELSSQVNAALQQREVRHYCNLSCGSGLSGAWFHTLAGAVRGRV